MNRFNKERELINSGLVYSIKMQYKNIPHNIPDKYFILMADYIDSISQLDYEGGLYLDPIQVARLLPQVLRTVKETNLGGVHGITDSNCIEMNSNMDYETNKLYFFHELTHALQTRIVQGHEECSFYNGKTGMFLTEGATQFTAEILYNVSNGTNINYRYQPNTVRGHPELTPYSPLSEYQLNGNILLLLSSSLGVPLNQLLALGFRSNGRDQIKSVYEAFPGNEGKFEEFMFDLEKIYSIDKLLIAGYREQLIGEPTKITMQGGQYQFMGNLEIQKKLIEQVERDLVSNFVYNNDENYIFENYQSVMSYITTPSLKKQFGLAVQELYKEVYRQQDQPSFSEPIMR